MENNQPTQYYHLYGAPALPLPNPNPSPNPSPHPLQAPTQRAPAFSQPLLPFGPLPAVPLPLPLPLPIAPQSVPVPASLQTYAPYQPATTVAPYLSQIPFPQQPPDPSDLSIARAGPSRRVKTSTTSKPKTKTSSKSVDTNPDDTSKSATGSFLPQKPKKPKTAARLAREMARKLKHRERRRIGRRERRGATKKGDGDGEDMIALEGVSDQTEGEMMGDGSESGEAEALGASEEVNGRNHNDSGFKNGAGRPPAPSFNVGNLLDYGSPESSGEVGKKNDVRRQSIPMSEAESGAASSLGSDFPRFDGPSEPKAMRYQGGSTGMDDSQISGGNQRSIPTGPRFQPPTGPRNADVYRFGDHGNRGGDRYRREEEGFRFESDGRGLHFPSTEPGYRDRRTRDNDRRPGDRRGFHTDSSRRYNDRDRTQRDQRGPRIPLPAHDRPILHVRRSATPEQFPAMVAAKRQRMDEEEEVDMDIDSSDESDTEPALLFPNSAPEDNQDTPPVSAILQTEEKSAAPVAVDPASEKPAAEVKKLDVIAMIRQAKKELLGNRKDTTSASGDFISLSGLDDETENRSKTEQAVQHIPSGPNFSHRDYLHAQESINKPLPIDTGVAPGTTIASQPLPPPPGLSESTSKKRVFSEMEPIPFITNKFPWLNAETGLAHSNSLYGSVWLHKEIVDFYDYIKPQPYEHAVRYDLVQRLRTAIRRRWPDADIRSFGSFAAEIYLPSSDMDVVLVSEQFMQTTRPKYNTASHIRGLARLLRQERIADNVVPILGAKVPIIKYKDRLTGLSVDISFENSSGLVANRTFRQWKEVYPEMPKLALLLKHFLAIRGINEPFNGGLGSFSLICMIVSLLQLMPEASSGNWHDGENVALGRLLMEFLELYGTKFNTVTTGIRVKVPGYFKKVSRPNLYNRNKPWALSIEDPNDPDNNIAKATYRIEEILTEFAIVFSEINNKMNALHGLPFDQRKHESLLAPMLAAFDYSSIDKQRKATADIFLRAGMGSLTDLIDLGGRDPGGPPSITPSYSRAPYEPEPNVDSKPFASKEHKKMAKRQRRAAKVNSRPEQGQHVQGKMHAPGADAVAARKEKKRFRKPGKGAIYAKK